MVVAVEVLWSLAVALPLGTVAAVWVAAMEIAPLPLLMIFGAYLVSQVALGMGLAYYRRRRERILVEIMSHIASAIKARFDRDRNYVDAQLALKADKPKQWEEILKSLSNDDELTPLVDFTTSSLCTGPRIQDHANRPKSSTDARCSGRMDQGVARQAGAGRSHRSRGLGGGCQVFECRR